MSDSRDYAASRRLVMSDAELIESLISTYDVNRFVTDEDKRAQLIQLLIDKVRENDTQRSAKNRVRDIKRERAKTVEACLAAVKLAGVQHENVAGCLHTEGRIHQNSLDIKAIKGVGDEY